MTATVVRYEPRGAAADLFRCRDPEVVLAGPAGTGKTLACLHRLFFACLQVPGIRCLIIRKTAVSLSSTTLVSLENRVAAEALAVGIVRWFGGSPREAASYRFGNGSVIVVGGMDAASKIMSSEYDLIFCDEATELTLTDWEAAATRLRNGVLPWQQIIGACNPDRPTHWLRERATRGALTMLSSRHRDNPAYFSAEGEATPAGASYMAKLDALTGVRRLRLRDGVWAAADGLVYETWDDSINLVDRFDPPADWVRYWSVDFGFVAPFVWQDWRVDGDGRLYLVAEMVWTQRLVEDWARVILRHVAPGGSWSGPRPRGVVCDHDAEDRATLERHLGLATVAARKTVSDGIQAMQARLRPAGDGRPRLMVVRDCVVEKDPAMVEAGKPIGLAEEVGGYVWAPTLDGRPAKEQPLKVDDHSMDASRYMCAEVDLGVRPRVRMM